MRKLLTIGPGVACLLLVILVNLAASVTAKGDTVRCVRGANAYEVPRDVCLSFGGKPTGESYTTPKPVRKKPNIAPAEENDTTPPSLSVCFKGE